MVFVIVGIVVVAACVTVLWYLRRRALARALTAQLAQPAASLPIRIQAGVLIAHDLILEDIAAAMSHTLSTSLDQEDDRDRHAAGLPVHPMETVLERAEAWAPSAIAVDFDVERLPGRVDVQDLESELTELSGSLVAASGATAAAATSLREIDALLGRLPAGAEDDVRWFRSLRLHMDALGLEATDGRLSSGPTYRRQRDEFPTRTATFIRECADGWNERFAATRGDVRSTATPPPLTSAHPEPLGPMVVELIASATALAESASAFLGKQRSRADGGADGTQDESARRLTWLDELQQNLSLAGRKVEEGSVLEASFILNGTPIPAMPWWRPGWRYRKAAHRVERHLRGLVAAQRQAIEMWAAAAAESWRSAVATYGEWVTAEGQALSSTRACPRGRLWPSPPGRCSKRCASSSAAHRHPAMTGSFDSLRRRAAPLPSPTPAFPAGRRGWRARWWEDRSSAPSSRTGASSGARTDNSSMRSPRPIGSRGRSAIFSLARERRLQVPSKGSWRPHDLRTTCGRRPSRSSGSCTTRAQPTPHGRPRSPSATGPPRGAPHARAVGQAVEQARARRRRPVLGRPRSTTSGLPS